MIMVDKTFEEIFEELARHNDRSVVWNNWLEYVIEINLLKDKPSEFEHDYKNNEPIYYDMMNAWLNELSVKLEDNNYYDLLGNFYEELVQSKSKSKQLGQAYTPQSVTNLLSDLVFNNDLEYSNDCVYDSAGGSGRTLLSAHVKAEGGVFCVSSDLDYTSCLMCVLNFFSHGVRGSVLNMDSLTNEFYTGWIVNRYLYQGLPVPHIEKIKYPVQALDFVERIGDDSVPAFMNELTSVKPKTDNVVTGSGQTTLI